MESITTMAPSPAPAPPATLQEAGLPEDLVAGLVVKTLYLRSAASAADLSDMLALPFRLLDDVVEQLQAQRQVQVKATNGPTRSDYVFGLTSEGRNRAAEELELSRYVGPAPVPLEDFRRWVERQTIHGTRVTPAELRQALEDIVVPEAMIELLGPALNSGRSLFLYGDSGNGKTLLARRLSRVFGHRYFVPWSVLVDGEIMAVYDPVYHGPVDADESGSADLGFGWTGADEPDTWAADCGDAAPQQGNGRASRAMLQEILRAVPAHDRRFAQARRPVVITGGELTLEQLELQWDGTGRTYQAPPQLKAAGGVLVVDDLGRQRVEVTDLLNRWAVPLEQRQDHLSLNSGRKITVPFDCFIIFSTNLEPRSLADDAFMRRIHYKIEVSDPTRDEYERIFRACCEERGVAYDERAVAYVYDEFYHKAGVMPRRCHPRDVLDHVRDIAEYRGEAVRLDAELLAPACRSYFLVSH
jgi:hypothetical protein